MGLDGHQRRRGVSTLACRCFCANGRSAKGPPCVWKRHKADKPAKLAGKGRPEMLAMGGTERAIAESVISTPKGDHTGLARCQQRCLKRSFDRFKTRVAKDHFPRERPARFREAPDDPGLWRLDFRLFSRPPFKRYPAQLARQLGFERVRMHVTHCVKQRGHLFLAGPDDAWIGVAGCGHTERRS